MPAVDPSRVSVVSIDASRLVRAGFERSGVQIAVENAQGVDAQVVSGAPAVDPFADVTAVDPEMKVAIVRLGRGDARVVRETEVEARPCVRVVFAQDVSRHIVEDFVRMRVDRYGKVTLAEFQRSTGGHQDVGAAAVEPGAVRGKRHAVILAVVGACMVPAVSVQSPMCDQC